MDYITRICKDTSGLVEQINYIENLPFGPLLSLKVNFSQHFKRGYSIFCAPVLRTCSAHSMI